MKRILKNYTRKGINGHFRYKDVYFAPKASVIFDMNNEEERGLYYYWKEIFDLIDITDRPDLKGVNEQ